MTIRLSKCSISENEINSVVDVLKKENLGMGSNVIDFENSIKDFLDTDMDVVCVNSGTAAIHLALLCLGIGDGDEVLVPSLTYVATYQAISATGAKPISCEVLADTLFLDVTDASQKLTSNTKAILPVYYASSGKGISEVYAFAKSNGLRVVEDAAQAFGSLVDGVNVGSTGDVVCFSFDGIKNITCGEGGALLSKDPKVIQIARDSRLLGVEKDTEMRSKGSRSWDFDVNFQGFRYHMSNINASIGVEQLKRIHEFKKRRQSIVSQYNLKLGRIENVKSLSFEFEEIMPHIFVLLVEKRDALRAELLHSGIECGIHYKPNHLLSKYLMESNLPVTEGLYQQVITLPCHVDLTDDEVHQVCEKVIKFYEK